ncbi:MAG: hypothetical protein Q9M31_10660 [Mariprofundus sp.]|nr:hypothetical protein [Mariprofundus sp.]
MIRNIFLTLIFFFGPVLLMFMLRNILLLLRIWLVARAERSDPEIIDVTPVEKQSAPRWFYLAAILLGLATAINGFIYLQKVDNQITQYIPAHVNEQGELVPSGRESLRPPVAK